MRFEVTKAGGLFSLYVNEEEIGSSFERKALFNRIETFLKARFP